LTTAGYLVFLVAFFVVVGGTLALGIWALRRHGKQYLKRSARLKRNLREPDTIESKTTWLSGGRG
jgi:Flp pilus assembly protein protease CpaA